MASKKMLDLRGECCPATNIKTVEALAAIPPGALLKVIVDNLSSLEGVMLTAKNGGHAIVQVDQDEDSVFTITIEKGV